MKAILMISLVMAAQVTAIAQPPDSLWSRTFGGSQIDQAYCVRQTTDGGFILTGWTQSFGAGNYDLYLIRTDANGDSLWTRMFGGTGEDRGTSVIEVADGFVVAGRTSSFPAGNENFWIIKADANGDTLWTRVYGGAAAERAYSIRETTDGGFIVAGNSGTGTTSDFWLIKTDANGDSLWSRRYGAAGVEDFCNSARQTADGGYVLAGYSGPTNSRSMWMVKTNGNGDSLWSRSYGSTGYESCRNVEQTTDGGYILGGNSATAAVLDMWMVKTDANGDTVWTRRFGTSGGQEECYWVEQTLDGGYVLAGYYNTNGDGWVVKTSANGDSTWSRRMGGTNTEVFYSVQQTADSGYVLAGYTMSYGAGSNDAWLVKLGAAVPQAGISVSPAQLVYGSVVVGDSSTLNLTIRSIGTADLNVTAITTSPYFHAAFQDPVMVPPGDSLVIPVTFVPAQAINYVDTLRITSNAPGSPTGVRMTGTGIIAEPGISVVPLELDFGFVWVGDTVSLPITIHSIGAVDLTVSSIQAPQDFLTDFVPPQTLPPGDSLVVMVMFAPYYYFDYDDTLLILSDAVEGPVEVHLLGSAIVDAADEPAEVPKTYSLSVYPNPFNAVASISFDLPLSGYVSLKLFDLQGREVKTLADEVREAGSFSILFDGEGLASGVYLCRINAGNYIATRKVVLIK